MPQPALHVLLARAALERWRAAPAEAPFDVSAPEIEQPFLQGSLGPDMGLFPGGDTRISLLAHGLRTGELARALVAAARSPAEQAFAWGWVTHVLADVRIHPIVNAAGTRLAARRGDRVRKLVDHVRVEVGLDAWYFGTTPELRPIRLRNTFDVRSVRFLARALRRTYGPALPRTRLLSSHRCVTRAYNAYTRLLAMLVEERRRMAEGVERTSALSILRAGVARRFAPTTPTWGFVHPVAPGESLLREVADAIVAYEGDLRHHIATGLALLPDYDLETGALLPAERGAVSARPRAHTITAAAPVLSI